MVKLTTDVLIVGGGPTGLLLSYYLLRAGIKIINVGNENFTPVSKKDRQVVI